MQRLNLLRDRRLERYAQLAGPLGKPGGRAVGADDTLIIEVNRLLRQPTTLRLIEIGEQDRARRRLYGALSRRSERPDSHVRQAGHHAADDPEHEVVPCLVRFQRRKVTVGELLRLHRCVLRRHHATVASAMSTLGALYCALGGTYARLPR